MRRPMKTVLHLFRYQRLRQQWSIPGDISIRVTAEGYAQKTSSVTLDAAAIAQEVTLALDKTGNLTPETQYTVNTSANIPEGGTVSPEMETVVAGDSVTIHAAANEGYAIESIWSTGIRTQ